MAAPNRAALSRVSQYELELRAAAHEEPEHEVSLLGRRERGGHEDVSAARQLVAPEDTPGADVVGGGGRLLDPVDAVHPVHLHL